MNVYQQNILTKALLCNGNAKKNHTWPSTFKNIRKGTLCPFCAIEINDSNIVLFTDLIIIYKYNLKDVHNNERKIVWKDFLLLFKKEFHHTIKW